MVHPRLAGLGWQSRDLPKLGRLKFHDLETTRQEMPQPCRQSIRNGLPRLAMVPTKTELPARDLPGRHLLGRSGRHAEAAQPPIRSKKTCCIRLFLPPSRR